MTTFRLAVVALCFSATMIIPAVAADPAGTWYTGDKESQVRITNCGGALCGSLVWLKEPESILPPAGPRPTRTIPTRRSRAGRLLACRSCSA